MNIHRSLLSFLSAIAFLLLDLPALSQNLLPPNQPEQDACTPLKLCGKSFFTPYSYTGYGKKIDLSGTPCIGGTAEVNSVWLRVKVATAGTIAFNIIPKDTTDDYDFNVLDATNVDCNDLNPAEVIRCNFNNNEPGSNSKGIVGLSDTATQTEVAGGTYGNGFVKSIIATPGQVILIMLNNWGNDITGGASAGFTIDFSPSTATFVDENIPTLDSVVRECVNTYITIQLASPVLCSSIAPDGSDFYTIPALPISGADGVNCVGTDGYTSQVNLYFGTQAPAGNYAVHAQTGTDGNTLLDLCGSALQLPAALPFTILNGIRGKLLPPDTTKCFYSTLTLASNRTFASYLWSSGQTTPAIQTMTPGTYTLYVTDSNNCKAVDSITIKDSTCPQYVFLPTAFTPNGGGHNDRFGPKFAGATVYYKFSIFDRWGRKVFESENPTVGWDGTSNGIPQPSGTYVWFCSYKLYQQKEELKQGTVMLIR